MNKRSAVFKTRPKCLFFLIKKKIFYQQAPKFNLIEVLFIANCSPHLLVPLFAPHGTCRWRSYDHDPNITSTASWLPAANAVHGRPARNIVWKAVIQYMLVGSLVPSGINTLGTSLQVCSCTVFLRVRRGHWSVTSPHTEGCPAPLWHKAVPRHR